MSEIKLHTVEELTKELSRMSVIARALMVRLGIYSTGFDAEELERVRNLQSVVTCNPEFTVAAYAIEKPAPQSSD